jgi:hypothetical protein
VISNRIGFEHIGIGNLLRTGRLRVPPNQRSYKWEEEHVTDLFQDLLKAIDGPDYFLGTIVLTGAANPIPEVTDGQQRLATTTILLTAIRDFFIGREEDKLVRQLEGDFLSFTEYGTKETVPRLGLNVDDSQFFTEAIISRPSERKQLRSGELSESNARLFNALILAKRHVESITSAFRESDRRAFLLSGSNSFAIRRP